MYARPDGDYAKSYKKKHGGDEGGYVYVEYGQWPIICFTLLGFALGILVGASCFSRKRTIKANENNMHDDPKLKSSVEVPTNQFEMQSKEESESGQNTARQS